MTSIALHPSPARPRSALTRQAAILAAVWAVPAAFMILQMYASAVVNDVPLPRVRSLVPAIIEWAIWVPLTPVIMRLARRYPITWPPRWRAVVVHAVGVGAAAVARGVVYAGATFLVARLPSTISFATFAWRNSLGWLPIAAVVWGAILAGAFALDYAQRLREREVRDAELREQLARAELGALRARLHPHFLFNALHSVSALVRGGENAAAVRVVAELSELLRDVLSRDAPDTVRLRDELAFVRRYLDIEAVRFADRLRVEWNVADAASEAIVPSLIVQPLVENAMRHAISASWSAGLVSIDAYVEGDALIVRVTDDGPGIGAPTPSLSNGNANGAGVGLADTRARIARLYGAAASLTLSPGERGGARASLVLPFRASHAPVA
ncbi:MAG TPA: histidine kinase [Gemmatimonadaceae bacterium]|nr:histidine kinase [Gemmatimonadaceae bacterium]